MRKELSITEARNQLTLLPELLTEPTDEVVITRRGQPVLAVLPWEQYDAIRETLEIMADESLLAALKESIQQARKSRLSWDKVKIALDL
ncbi:MAG TPA: type II toxin-antitoxin system prevent-host-death family antitoxin [Burkholderiales bacterium]|nr:type II toxin-antitoxin system prevent-host-death family antitoxin [Burkholderiales bacterium]